MLCALSLRSTLLNPEQRPALLTPAPLFSMLHVWGQAALPAGRIHPKFMPWLLLLSLLTLEGPVAALPGLLGCGAGAMFEAFIGSPPPAAAPPRPADQGAAQPPPAGPADAATPSGADGASAADSAAGGAAATIGAGAAATAGGNAPNAPDGAAAQVRQPSFLSRVLQMLAVMWLIAALTIDPNGASEAAQMQCGLLARTFDLSDPLTAQLVSNFTSDRIELLKDAGGRSLRVGVRVRVGGLGLGVRVGDGGLGLGLGLRLGLSAIRLSLIGSLLTHSVLTHSVRTHSCSPPLLRVVGMRLFPNR